MALVRTHRNMVVVLVVVALALGVGVGIAASAGAGTGTVYVATGENFPDALGAGATGGVNAGPVLLVQPNAIPAATLAEINRLEPFRIIIVGGTAAVSQAVEDQLRALSFGPIVVRHGGANRYETAALLSQSTFPVPGAVSCSATGFEPRTSSDGYTGSAAERIPLSATPYICPLSIPDGARVTALTGGLRDSNATLGATCSLIRVDLVGGSFGIGIGWHVTMGVTSETTGSSSTYQRVSTSTIVEPLVDNSRYGYLVDCRMQTSMGIVGATVEYEMTG